MRQFIDIVEARRRTEPPPTERPVTTIDQPEAGNFDFLRGFQGGGAVARAGPGTNVAQPLPGRRAQRRPRANLSPEMTARASELMGRMPDLGDDEISDDEARRNAGGDVGYEEPVPPTTENLPAVIGRDVARTGGRVNPEWHQIKSFPGYVKNAIRALGRSVFRQFTDVPIEDIQLLTTLGGINSETEVLGMMDWIRRHGVKDDAATLDFEQIMPGYQAEASLWRTDDYGFLLVRDFGGYYIYGFADGRGTRVAAPPERRRLR